MERGRRAGLSALTVARRAPASGRRLLCGARSYPEDVASDPTCPSGVCAAEPPPLIGSVLTGVGMTLAQAAAALERGEAPPLTDVQRRIVEDWAQRQLAARP